MNSRPDENDVNPDLTTNPVSGSDSVSSPTFDDAQPAVDTGSDIDLGATDTSTPERTEPGPTPVNTSGGGLGSAWVTLVIGAVLLILLLVFVLQNQNSIDISFIAWEFSMPSGVLILLAAIVGALVMAMVAAMRIFQLRHRARKANKSMATKSKKRKR